VARLHLMRDWFVRHLSPEGAPEPVTQVAARSGAVMAGTRRSEA